jgi:hypothetical protein
VCWATATWTETTSNCDCPTRTGQAVLPGCVAPVCNVAINEQRLHMSSLMASGPEVTLWGCWEMFGTESS